MFKKTLSTLICLALLTTCVGAFAEDADWREPYPEPVQITVGVPEVTNARFAEGESMEDNLWTRLFKERFNIEVIVEWVSLEYDNKVNLAIASNTLPNAFNCNTVQFNQLKEAGLIQDLKAAYETYASPSMKAMMERNWDIVETAMDGDAILAMPRLHYGFETMTSFIWARNDWLESNGITELKSVDEFEAMMRAFMDNNGSKYGVMLEKTLEPFFQMAPAFHVYPKIWVEAPDGTIQYGGTMPEMKAMLETWARWYQEGYILADFATMDFAAVLEDAYNGEVGTYAQQNWAGWQIGKDMVENQGDGSHFIAMEMPAIDAEQVKYPIGFANSVYNVVTNGYEHPEVLIKLVGCYVDVLDDAVNNGTMTIEEVLPFNSNDMHHVTGPFKVEFQHYNDIKEVVAGVTGKGDTFSTGNAYSFYNEIMKWVDGGDLTSLGRYLQMGYDESSLARAIGHVDNDQILKTKMWGQQPQVVLDYGTTLSDLLIEGYTEIIMGIESVDYFDTLVENWKAAGGEQCIEAVNEMYGAK